MTQDEDDIPNYKFRRPDPDEDPPDADDERGEPKSADFVQCPACKKYIYAEAAACPRCGHYMTESDTWAKKPRWFIYTALILLALFALGLLVNLLVALRW